MNKPLLSSKLLRKITNLDFRYDRTGSYVGFDMLIAYLFTKETAETFSISQKGRPFVKEICASKYFNKLEWQYHRDEK